MDEHLEHSLSQEWRCARCNRPSGYTGHYLGEDPTAVEGLWRCDPAAVVTERERLLRIVLGPGSK